MRKLSPAFIVTSVALALASGSALAQGVRAGTSAPSTTASQPSGSSGDANGAFRNTPNSPNATPTGVALGQSPGQTSSGTLAGNSSAGLGVTGNDVFNPTPGVATTGNATQAGAGVVTTTMDAGVNANGERIETGSVASAPASAPAATPTPLFELTARQGAAKEAARRARGEEPRVYGIAPRTDRDLTRQMPDDPVIRY